MPNQTPYYSRMAKSAPDKIAAISPYTKPGTRVLDFGSGLNLDVAEFVSGRGGAYTSVDNERSVVDAASGDLLATLSSTTFCRADGGFGGPSGPLKSVHELPTRGLDHS